MGMTLLPWFQRLKFFYAVEQSCLSLRLQFRGQEIPDEDEDKIIILAVDDRSLARDFSQQDLDNNFDLELLLDPWPWDRAVHGIVADKLIQAGAKAVAFDFVFPTPNPGNADFKEVIERYPNQIVLGYDYVPMESQLVGDIRVQENLPIEELLPENIDNLLGFVNIERDSDGALRRAKVSTNISAENSYFKEDPETYEKLVRRAHSTPLELSLGARTAALVDPEFAANPPPFTYRPIINYGGEAGFFTTISYLDVILEDRFESRKGIFKDAIVIAGPFDDFFKDVIPTPLGDMFGVETHAHVLRSILTESFYKPLSDKKNLAIITLFSGILVIGNLRLKAAWMKGAWLFGITLAYFALSQIAFETGRWVIPSVPVMWIVVFGGFILLIYDFVIDQYERQQLRGYLNRYVSPDVARILVDNRDGFDQLLQGASRPIAVLFSDIRGFTTLSERYTPQGLVNHLNEYFQGMVDSILNRRGSLNKYIGDAILAVWGDVYTQGPQTDCTAAVSSALEMVTKLEALNADWESRDDRLPLGIGVGISYGEAFVGNMGHPNRMEVAVMGDVVNLGSRLEGATKQYGCAVLVSEEVVKNSDDTYQYQELDIIQVKGKTEGIRIYTPVCKVDEVAPAWLESWHEALETYRSREFDLAHEKFTELAQVSLELEKQSSLYLERCLELQKNPPPDNWDYVFIMTTK